MKIKFVWSSIKANWSVYQGLATLDFFREYRACSGKQNAIRTLQWLFQRFCYKMNYFSKVVLDVNCFQNWNVVYVLVTRRITQVASFVPPLGEKLLSSLGHLPLTGNEAFCIQEGYYTIRVRLLVVGKNTPMFKCKKVTISHRQMLLCIGDRDHCIDVQYKNFTTYQCYPCPDVSKRVTMPQCCSHISVTLHWW